ncbi:MAG: AmmeMemoRadiSam system protein B [Anaerolineales bacterium]|nr:MAG: AmmeMemoRadiSam system protein B [Anaerolineales bacterium]
MNKIDPKNVRRAVIAGSWYPGTEEQLRKAVQGYLDNVEKEELEGELMGLISPHAGYIYSGQVAAYAYKQLDGASLRQPFDRAQDIAYDAVVVISPVHRVPLGRFAVTSAAAYETPLGMVKLDGELVGALEEKVRINRVSHDGEHSLEIQLPFLQVALGDFRLLPVMIGESSFEAGEELGTALAEVLRDKKALVVASTDLHHIENYDEVVRRDKVVVEAIASFDMARIKEVLSPWDCSVCGRIPVYAMLTAARALGANKVGVLHHTNSGDVTGIRTPGQYVVGYLAAAVYRGQ